MKFSPPIQVRKYLTHEFCFCSLKKICISIRDFDYNAEETINANILNIVYFVCLHRKN